MVIAPARSTDVDRHSDRRQKRLHPQVGRAAEHVCEPCRTRAKVEGQGPIDDLLPLPSSSLSAAPIRIGHRNQPVLEQAPRRTVFVSTKTLDKDPSLGNDRAILSAWESSRSRVCRRRRTALPAMRPAGLGHGYDRAARRSACRRADPVPPLWRTSCAGRRGARRPWMAR